MQAFGYLTLGILLFVLVEQEIDSNNPCSQFSAQNRQSLCSSDTYPSNEHTDEE